MLDTNIILRLNIKAQKLFLSLFLLTGFINNSYAIEDIISDTIKKERTYFDSEIEKSADDSIKMDIINKKAYLFGNAKIKAPRPAFELFGRPGLGRPGQEMRKVDLPDP